MDNFFEQFKGNLDRRPLPEFDPGDWADMQGRLDRAVAVGRSPVHWGYWAMGAVLLLLLGSNWFIFKELKRANDKILQLESQIDTVYLKTIIYQGATTAPDPASTSERAPLNSNKISGQSTPAFDPATELPASTVHKGSQQTGLFPPPDQPKQAAKATGSAPVAVEPIGAPESAQEVQGGKLRATQLPTLELIAAKGLSRSPQLQGSWAATTTQGKRKRKTMAQLIYPMRPQALAIGLMGGRTVLTPEQVGAYSNFDIGLQSYLIFSPAFRLRLAADYLDWAYETRMMGSKTGVPEISVPGSDEDYRFEQACVSRSAWSAELSLEYNLPFKKWQPYMGAGVGFTSLIENEVRYEFHDKKPPGGGHHDPPHPSPPKEPIAEKVNYETGQALEFASLRAGLRYQISKHWLAQVEGNYRLQLETANNQVPDRLDARIGLFYEF